MVQWFGACLSRMTSDIGHITPSVSSYSKDYYQQRFGPFAHTFSPQYVISIGQNLRIYLEQHTRHNVCATAYRSLYKLCEKGMINFFKWFMHIMFKFMPEQHMICMGPHPICWPSSKHMHSECVTKCKLKLAPSSQGSEPSFCCCWHFSSILDTVVLTVRGFEESVLNLGSWMRNKTLIRECSISYHSTATNAIFENVCVELGRI